MKNIKEILFRTVFNFAAISFILVIGCEVAAAQDAVSGSLKETTDEIAKLFELADYLYIGTVNLAGYLISRFPATKNFFDKYIPNMRIRMAALGITIAFAFSLSTVTCVGIVKFIIDYLLSNGIYENALKPMLGKSRINK